MTSGWPTKALCGLCDAPAMVLIHEIATWLCPEHYDRWRRDNGRV
jgi:hypothetical protein